MLVPPFLRQPLAAAPADIAGAGQNQVRFFKLEGQRPTLRTPEQALKDADGAAENRTSPQADHVDGHLDEVVRVDVTVH